MPVITLVPDAIITNTGWTNSDNIFSDNNEYASYTEATEEENILLFSLNIKLYLIQKILNEF